MNFFTCLLVLAALAVLLKLAKTKLALPYKLILNTLCGYACLILVNLFSFFTGTAFSLNIVTAVLVGFLGLPGIILLFLVRFFVL